MSDHDEFVSGERPEDVLIYLADETLGNPDALADVGERVDGGVVLVVPGDQGRQALQSAAGVDPMAFAKEAMDADGDVDADCTGGTCPNAGAGDQAIDHAVRFVFAFAEEQNPEAGDIYAEGDVLHAYARCACGQAYSEKWVAGER
jgi:hypothetical protein